MTKTDFGRTRIVCKTFRQYDMFRFGLRSGRNLPIVKSGKRIFLRFLASWVTVGHGPRYVVLTKPGLTFRELLSISYNPFCSHSYGNILTMQGT